MLAVPNDFTREWIEGHFLGLIRAAVNDATGHERRVQLTVRERRSGRAGTEGRRGERAPAAPAPEPAAAGRR